MPELSQPSYPSISVVICCHNSAARLPETLRHLAQQQVPSGLEWEIVVIDNASTDETLNVVHQFSIQYSGIVVRLVSEPRLGTGYARQRGIAEALREIVLFVDDDNWLAPDYLHLTAQIMKQHPEVGALGGMSSACCEGPEPAWLPRYQGWYAVTGAPNGAASLREEGFLWTAGTAFRRRILDGLKGSTLLVSGRRGQSLDAGEDHELCNLMQRCGEKLYRYSGLHFRHYLPAARLTWDYLKRLHYGEGLVSVKLDAYRMETTSSTWRKWLLQSWWAQLVYVWFKILRYQLWLGLSPADVPGDARVLFLQIYRGRLAALWSHRGAYRQMVTGKGALSGPSIAG